MVIKTHKIQSYHIQEEDGRTLNRRKRKDVHSLDLDCPSECLSVWAEEEEEGEEEGAIG